MQGFDYEQLDPGIRDAVRWFHDLGYETTDSGDGVTKAPDPSCVMPWPHVCVVLGSSTKTAEAKFRRLVEDQWRGCSVDYFDGPEGRRYAVVFPEGTP